MKRYYDLEPELLNPIVEAEALCSALMEVAWRSSRLIASLRMPSQPWQNFKIAWALLKQLRR